MRLPIIAVAIIGICSTALADEKQSDAGWTDLLKQIKTSDNAVHGNWKQTRDALTVDAATNARLAIPFQPGTEYDFRVSFTRNTGVHSIALIFTAGGRQASFEIDAWGEHLAGIQNIKGQDIRRNPTLTRDQRLENGKRYTATVQVRRDRIQAFLEDKLIATHRSDGSDLNLLDLWKLPSTKVLGIGAYQASTTFHSIQVRNVSGSGTTVASKTTPRPRTTPTPTPNNPRPTTPRPTTPRPSAGKGNRVLIVIANNDFFYREYADPRQELERAGFEVVVAAGRREPSRPHNGSGQSGDGVVRPDVALSDVKADDFQAIVFSGGWGSSQYQYAFRGSYSNREYNGNRQTKSVVNRLLNDFVKHDKYIGGICHGVSVLAWARVNGRSLLNGKRVCAPPRSGPVGIYNGRQAQPPSRWNSEVNGAQLHPAGSIGNPNSATDAVAVDGKILTAEDDKSARELGRRLGALLKGQSK